MPAPIAFSPLAWTALRLGAVAGVSLYAARSRTSSPKDPRHETVLDDLPEGHAVESHKAESENAMRGRSRFRRVVRLRPNGPGLEIDAAALGRVRFRRVD